MARERFVASFPRHIGFPEFRSWTPRRRPLSIREANGERQHARTNFRLARTAGGQLYGAADQFRFVCRAWTGDGEIIARIDSDPDQEARQVCAGVMFRDGLGADSHHVAILLDPHGKCHAKYRDEANPASACHISGNDSPGKHSVRLVRRGNTFTASTRPDGAEAWQPVEELELPLHSSLYVGMAVTAHDDAQLATTTIDYVSLRGRPQP
jgi:hypothetical protein